ncbi:MAG: nitroreductase family protein [Synergistaceae bacterium]|jgi:nitroreductase|nr:nitroreductase family protein [Synergistaceae bacterium]
MNEVLRTILERRSIRKYTPEEVSRADIEAILQAGLYAPSGAGAETWHFTVITDKKVIEDFDARTRAAMAESGIERIETMGKAPHYRVFFGAPVVILICGEKIPRKPGRHLTSLADCSAAIENMHLAAVSLGLGACWIGLVRYLFEREPAFMAPEGYEPLFALTLGHPDETPASRAPRREGTVRWLDAGI